MNSIRKSLGYSLLSSNAVTSLQFFGSLIIARLLTPEQIGIFSVASVVVAVAQIMRDFGVTSYIIQVETLSMALLRTAFGLALLVALGLATLVGLSSSVVASFYGEPQMQEVMLILALNFALTPFGSLALACARRQMRFRAIGIIDVLSAIVSLGTTIVLSLQGMGAISLAWGAIAGSLTTVTGAQFLRPAEMPIWPSLKGCVAILRFGSLTTASSITGYLNMAAAELILGKMLGMSAVAYFNRASSLNRFVASGFAKALNPVLLPLLSELRRNGENIREYYHLGTTFATGILWPVFGLIGILSEPLIMVLFGEQWRQSARLVPYFAATAMISASFTMASATYLALGRPKYNLIAELINLPIKIISIIILAPYGLIYVAFSWPFIALAGAVVHSIFLYRLINISPTMLFPALYKSLIVTIGTAAAASVTSHIIAYRIEGIYALQLLFSAIAGCITWSLLIYKINHPLKKEFDNFIKSKANK